MATKTAQDEFQEAVKAASVSPLWERFQTEGMPTEPEPMAPHVWRWAELEPLTERAARDVPMEDVERRVLTLKNPHMEGNGLGTTGNLVGALQTLLPGESARPHRHSGNALRFMLQGGGAETTVDGKTCVMNDRDMIITPLWSWHAHVHAGNERVVWFDALDIPLFRRMNAAFFEEGPPPNLPPQTPDAAFAAGGLVPVTAGHASEAPPYSPMFRYPWGAVLEALEAMPAESDGSRKLRYTNPHTGGPAMNLTECFVLALAGGRATTAYRTTSDAICVVAEGAGESQVGDHKFAWERNDIFTLPGWNWISHSAATNDAKLFMVTDRDTMERLGMLREESRS